MSNTNFDRQFRPLPVPSVTVQGMFGERQDAICDVTAETILDRCVDAGMVRAIDTSLSAPGMINPIQSWGGSTQMFWDSDLGKAIETIAYSLFRRRNAKLEARVDQIIGLYEKLQGSDGYLNAWFQRVQPDRRWTNLRDFHELYCAGHLIEAAVAYFEATGKDKLLNVMCRYADYLTTVFGTNEGQMRGYCGHEEIELAFVKLGRLKGSQKYLDLAKYFIDERGSRPNYFSEEALRDGRDASKFFFKTDEYNQSHQPVREQKKVVGHAVRAMYLYSGMADIATEYGDDTLTAALETLWDDLTNKQMYVTGGIGPSASNEGFTAHYDLPNENAYAETCAAVGLVFWANRMLGRGPNRRYADVMEQVLYNGAMSGLSLDGKAFFYENPLESSGKHHRWVWHHCPCCPPNIARLLASVGSYMYALAQDELAIHLFGESSARFSIKNTSIELQQITDYPWTDLIQFIVKPQSPARFAISVRIPEWADGAILKINGKPIDLASVTVYGYARLDRQWVRGDQIDLRIPLVTRALYSNPLVRKNVGRVALMRGPIVYCAEEIDNKGELNLIQLLGNPSAAKVTEIAELAGAVALDLPVTREQTDWGTTLYRTNPPTLQSGTARFVPYSYWDNREPGEMLVWIRTRD